MTEPSLSLIAPHEVQWGAFVCADALIEARISQEVQAATRGLRALYELSADGFVIALFTVQVGALQADHTVLAGLSPQEPLAVPTLHIPVIAVHQNHQRAGLGRRLMEFLINLAREQAPNLGIKTLSLESTPNSDGFYTSLGFDRSEQTWPDGSRARWMILR
ncbi:GNAT family N-acetyltransferase [Deinococcus koreensis]|uniref:N-acetyltransferase domain-containing protein n=1 Tax=Deinococcus koreensis TaxID=2054903 RepID=A0A2K3V1T4_9DEIO|nr:GNAT family N-acetyltransferase [Deinococcus koreensis]PNY82750.1 hypothetical protein CVO96_16560 [Deinococcus koreensis]